MFSVMPPSLRVRPSRLISMVLDKESKSVTTWLRVWKKEDI